MTLPAEELNKYDNLFDVFEKSSEPSEMLIRRGLYPPLPVTEKRLVWGFPIVKKALSSGVQDLAVIPVSGDITFLVAVALQLENRKDGYSLKEEADIIRLVRAGGEEKAIRDIEFLLRSSGSVGRHVDNYLSLSPEIRELVDTGCSDLKTAAKLVNFDEKVCSRVKGLQTRFTFSGMKRFLTLLNEIGKRDSLGPAAMLSCVDTALEQEDPVAALHASRFPELSGLEREIHRFKAGRLKGSGITLSHPPGFEGHALTVSFKIRSGEDLRVRCRTLDKLSDSMDELISSIF